MATMCGAEGLAILAKTGDLPEQKKDEMKRLSQRCGKVVALLTLCFQTFPLDNDCRLPSS
jgi:hypothetical protein